MSHRIAAVAHRRRQSRSRKACPLPSDPGVDLVDLEPAGPEAFTIRVTSASDGFCIALSGDMTAIDVARLAECLDDALDYELRRIVIDLKGLRSLDPSVLSTLLVAHRRAFDDHRELLLIRGHAPVQQIIDRIDGPFCYIPK